MATSTSITPRSVPARNRRRFFVHWRTTVALSFLALTAYIASARQLDLLLLELIAAVFLASQIFWLKRVIDLGERLAPVGLGRSRIAVAVGLAYLFLVAYSFPNTIGQGHIFRAGFERMPNILAAAAFWWWFVGSISGFLLVIAFGAARYAGWAALWLYGRAARPSQPRAVTISEVTRPFDRRQFLRQMTVLVSATPFVAAGYGLLYGRKDVEIVRQRVRLATLPKAFHGFRIAQLSDIHMGPFAATSYVHRCVAITNDLHADLIALTGDFIAWDIGYVEEVVRTLGALRAPHGVFGCLGNHESESDSEDLIASLFARDGVHMLRQARVAIQRGDDVLNLAGIDDVRGGTLEQRKRDLQRRLRRELVVPGVVNILLAHEPSELILNRAAELGIDLVLAGHTHGGQLALESIHRGLNVSHLLYPYTSGWYQKSGTRLYVNRGIGTTGFPIRFGARPEITLFELTAA